MLLPIDPSTLHENPKFASLYRQLTTSILNSEDGSIKVSIAETEAQAKVQAVSTIHLYLRPSYHHRRQKKK